MNFLERATSSGTEHGAISVDTDAVTISANGLTDWFFRPAGPRLALVPQLAAAVEAPAFTLQARVAVEFAATYDAGALFVSTSDAHWAKLAFERSAQCCPTAVSVVTKDSSDDADGPICEVDALWLRLYVDANRIAFHFSEDGRLWRFLRVFALPDAAARPIRVGLSAQSPTGVGCRAMFSDVFLAEREISDLRDGS